MLYLRQSTAAQARLLGPFVAEADGITLLTALTIANTDVKLSKAGGTMAAKNSGGGTHDADGWYAITLDATDTNTVGTLQVSCKMATALSVYFEATVLTQQAYDSIYGSAASGAQQPLSTGTARGGGNNPGTITLQSGEPVLVDYYNGAQVEIIGGQGIGQSRLITDYSAGTDCTVDRNWITIPNTTSIYRIVGAPVYAHEAGTVTGNVDGSVGSVTGGINTTGGSKTTLDQLNDIVATDIVTGGAITTSGGAVSSVTAVGSVSGAVGSVTNPVTAGTVNDKTGYSISGAITTLDGLENISATEVGTQCDASLGTMFNSSHAEPTTAPAANATVLEKIAYLFSGLRNKVTVNASQKTFYQDNDVVMFTKNLADDGSTYTENEAT